MPGNSSGGRPEGGGPRRGGIPVERVRDEHPEGDSWRADALAASRHSRLLDELRRPLEDHRPERAAEVCGDVARAILRDFAPALILLPAAERRRAQALAAYALTLFDFAAQTGLEGERLSQINRWEFELEAALSGRPAGQPVWVLLAAEERRRPWPREALDALGDAARGVVVRGRGGSIGAPARSATATGAALASAPRRPAAAAPRAPGPGRGSPAAAPRAARRGPPGRRPRRGAGGRDDREGRRRRVRPPRLGARRGADRRFLPARPLPLRGALPRPGGEPPAREDRATRRRRRRLPPEPGRPRPPRPRAPLPLGPLRHSALPARAVRRSGQPKNGLATRTAPYRCPWARSSE